MRNHIIRQIVEEVFEKAKKNCPSDAHTTLSNYIEAQSNPRISYKTAVRAYKKYIDKEETDWSPNPESVKNFCIHLGYDDYKDYVENNINNDQKDEESKNEKKPNNTEIDTSDKGKEGRKKRKWILIISTIFSSIVVLFLYNYLSKPKTLKETKPPIECMAWADNHYEKVDCDLQLHPKYGTNVKKDSPSLRKSMRRLENVDASFPFFSEETHKPLVWYYKNKNGTLEYFTAPGLHPVTGETLKKITEGMIEKYVPIHKIQPDSFISNETISSTKKGISILVLNKNVFDDKLTESLKANYSNNYSSFTWLKDYDIYNEDFISKFNSKEKLLLQNMSIVTDTIMLGLSYYSFSNNPDIENMIICNAQIDFSIYYKTNQSWNEFLSKNINSIGTGYSEIEAKTNAIKKINYD